MCYKLVHYKRSLSCSFHYFLWRKGVWGQKRPQILNVLISFGPNMRVKAYYGQKVSFTSQSCTTLMYTLQHIKYTIKVKGIVPQKVEKEKCVHCSMGSQETPLDRQAPLAFSPIATNNFLHFLYWNTEESAIYPHNKGFDFIIRLQYGLLFLRSYYFEISLKWVFIARISPVWKILYIYLRPEFFATFQIILMGW